jgi:hypothetical protein
MSVPVLRRTKSHDPVLAPTIAWQVSMGFVAYQQTCFNSFCPKCILLHSEVAFHSFSSLSFSIYFVLSTSYPCMFLLDNFSSIVLCLHGFFCSQAIRSVYLGSTSAPPRFLGADTNVPPCKESKKNRNTAMKSKIAEPHPI